MMQTTTMSQVGMNMGLTPQEKYQAQQPQDEDRQDGLDDSLFGFVIHVRGFVIMSKRILQCFCSFNAFLCIFINCFMVMIG